MVLVFAERSDDELFRQALAFARGLEDGIQAVAIDDAGGYSPDGSATSLANLIRERAPSAVVAPGTDRGNEVLAHVAAELDLPMAANCMAATPGDPMTLTRVRWGGSLLEEGRAARRAGAADRRPHAVAGRPGSRERRRRERFRRPPGGSRYPSASRRSAPASRWPTRTSSCRAGGGSGRPRASA